MASLSSLNFRLTTNIKPFKTGLNKAQREVDRFGKKMQQTGKRMTAKFTAPLAAIGAVGFNTFKNFEAEMSKVQAVSGATAQEFQALSDNAKELGASTMFSAREVASLQTEFAKLGFTATEITQVTESTLALAQASGSDLARAAEVAGSTLRAFGLDASETGRVTDVMASSFSSSALDINLFADSMKFVAPVAKSAGMSIEETSAMLAVLANNGIKGSQAGTALRRIISEIGATGKPTAEALKDLASQGLDLADAKDEVGRSAQSALLVLAEGVDQIKPLQTQFENSAGAAKEMADIMGDTAFGAVKRLESATEGLMISIGEVVAIAIVPLVEKLASLISALNKTSPSLKKFVVGLGALLALSGPTIFFLGGMLRNLKFLKLAFVSSGKAAKVAAVATRFFNTILKANPVGLAITAITALAGVFSLLKRKQEEVIENNDELSDSAKEEIASTKTRATAANNLIEALKNENIASEDRRRIINRLNTEYGDLLPNQISEKSNIDDLTTAQKNLNAEVLKRIKIIAIEDQIAEATERAVDQQKKLTDAQQKLTDAQNKYTEATGETLDENTALRLALTDLNNPFLHLIQNVSNAFGDVGRFSLGLQQATSDLADLENGLISITPPIEKTGEDLENTGNTAKRTAQALLEVPRKSEAGFAKMKPMAEVVRKEMTDLFHVVQDVSRSLSNAFALSLRKAFGELRKGESRFQVFKESMINMLRDMAIQFIATATAAFALAVAIRLAFGGFAGLGGISDIFGTMQSVSGFMKNVPALAEGGIVTGPTLAMIGEGGESEAVVPLSKLGTMINSGSTQVEVVGRISGSDILLSNERAQRTRQRQRGF